MDAYDHNYPPLSVVSEVSSIICAVSAVCSAGWFERLSFPFDAPCATKRPCFVSPFLFQWDFLCSHLGLIVLFAVHFWSSSSSSPQHSGHNGMLHQPPTEFTCGVNVNWSQPVMFYHWCTSLDDRIRHVTVTIEKASAFFLHSRSSVIKGEILFLSCLIGSPRFNLRLCHELAEIRSFAFVSFMPATK